MAKVLDELPILPEGMEFCACYWPAVDEAAILHIYHEHGPRRGRTLCGLHPPRDGWSWDLFSEMYCERCLRSLQKVKEKENG